MHNNLFKSILLFFWKKGGNTHTLQSNAQWHSKENFPFYEGKNPNETSAKYSLCALCSPSNKAYLYVWCYCTNKMYFALTIKVCTLVHGESMFCLVGWLQFEVICTTDGASGNKRKTKIETYLEHTSIRMCYLHFEFGFFTFCNASVGNSHDGCVNVCNDNDTSFLCVLSLGWRLNIKLNDIYLY